MLIKKEHREESIIKSCKKNGISKKFHQGTKDPIVRLQHTENDKNRIIMEWKLTAMRLRTNKKNMIVLL